MESPLTKIIQPSKRIVIYARADVNEERKVARILPDGLKLV